MHFLTLHIADFCKILPLCKMKTFGKKNKKNMQACCRRHSRLQELLFLCFFFLFQICLFCSMSLRTVSCSVQMVTACRYILQPGIAVITDECVCVCGWGRGEDSQETHS